MTTPQVRARRGAIPERVFIGYLLPPRGDVGSANPSCHSGMLSLDTMVVSGEECSPFHSREAIMERSIAAARLLTLPEQVLFLGKSLLFISGCAAILYVALAAEYPAVHDTLHNFRHALAVVPCH